jgi:hypothetical protein
MVRVDSHVTGFVINSKSSGVLSITVLPCFSILSLIEPGERGILSLVTPELIVNDAV